MCFKTIDELIGFCTHNNLILDNNVAEYDFDTMPANPIDYTDVLNKWNMLDTISSNLNITFEGSENKYDEVYDYLFSCYFAVNPLPELYKIPNEYFQLINNVFDKQTEILEKITYFNDNE